jgi:sRNA-binding regulator protein Hfq
MFNFAVQENGTVLVFDHFKVNAKSKRNKLIFKTSKVKIDPDEISGGKVLSYHVWC